VAENLPTRESGKRAVARLLDEFVAPGLSTLRKQRLPALPRELRPDPLQFAMTAFLLPHAFGRKIEQKTRIRVFNFIRRTRNAYDEYEVAKRAYTKYFVERKNPQPYLSAVRHFENCFASCYQGHELLFAIANREFANKDSEGRGELNYRMSRLYNESKHTKGMIDAQTFQGENISLWISNDGFETKRARMTFAELAEILQDMGITSRLLARSDVWRGNESNDK
jgi:hypothetical protein